MSISSLPAQVREALDFTAPKMMLPTKARTISIEPTVQRLPDYADSARTKTTQSDAVLGGETITFRIPPMKRCFVDQKNSYLKFDVGCYNYSSYTDASGNTVNEGYSMYIDGSCASFFQKIQVSQGGRILESLNEIGQIYSLLMDGGTELDSRESSLNILMGTYMSAVSASNTFIRSGKFWSTATTATTLSSTLIGRNSTTTFAMPLISGILGILANRYLPIDTLENPLEIEFTLAPFKQGLVYPNTTINWTEQYHWINNLSLELAVIELSPEVYNAVHSQNNGIYNISSESFYSHSEMLPDSLNYTVAVPNAHFKGLQRAFVCLYHKNFRSTRYICGTTSRRLYRLSECQFRINSNYYPQRPIKCDINTSDGINVYLEALRCFRNPKGIMFPRNNLDAENFFTSAEMPTISSGGPNSAGRCGGFVGYNFQAFEDDSLYNGIDTSAETSDLLIDMKFSGSHANDMCFVFINYDMMIRVENGRYTVHK